MTLQERLEAAAAEYAARGRPSGETERMEELTSGVKTFVLRPCPHRGAVLDTTDVPCCGGKVRRNERFACSHPRNTGGDAWSMMCQKCILAAQDAPAPDVPGPDFTGSLIIPSLNEDERLARTWLSARTVAPWVKQIGIDDCSARPQPGCRLRNARRSGVALSRHLGAALAEGEVLYFADAHMEFAATAFERVGRVARETHGFAYCGCNGHAAAALKQEGGLLRCKWIPKPSGAQARTTAMMGAFYAVERSVLEAMGGWAALPGHWGQDEEIMSILAARHKVPITCVLDVENWHEFHNQPNVPDRPYTLDSLKYLVNVAAVYRFCFDDRTWPLFRERLSSFSWDGGQVRIGDDLFGIVESPAMLEYGRRLRARFKTTDLDFLLEGWPRD